MRSTERTPHHERQQEAWSASEELEQLVSDLFAAGKMDYTHTGYASVLTQTGDDLLVVQELEPHVLMLLTYTAAGARFALGPDIELVSYIDRHGAYYPLLLRGEQIRRSSRVRQQTAVTAFADYVVRHLVQTGWVEWGRPAEHGRETHALIPALRVTREEQQRLRGWLVAQRLCEATDGCFVLPDDRCPHGAVSWFAELGLI
jgi:hypothetical protein